VPLNPSLDIFVSKSKILPMKKLYVITAILLGILVITSFAQAEKTGSEMVKVPKGCFQMGTNEVHRYFDHEEEEDPMGATRRTTRLPSGISTRVPNSPAFHPVAGSRTV
jgi:formylglycine-generating enzyme required for sulfatase activity